MHAHFICLFCRIIVDITLRSLKKKKTELFTFIFVLVPDPVTSTLCGSYFC